MVIKIVTVKKGRNNIGTNFYWFKEKQKEDFEHHEGLHIGNRSCGWVFHFQAHHEPFLHSFNDYKKFLKQGYIYDEYDRYIPYKDFIKAVKDTKKSDDGEAPWDFNNCPDSEKYQLCEEWMNEGYMFSVGDFS